ncbi:MAG: nitroreductase family protein [Rubritepida sp.]|nr:nitroreductase family protein [Rubritepida sp.]
MAAYDAAVAATRAALPAQPGTRDLLRFATLAASGHNTQPWRFAVDPRQISILPDLSRRTPIVDPDDHHLFVSLGCAAENLRLAAASRGRPGSIGFEASAVTFTFGDGQAAEPALFDAIARRQSTRAEYDATPVDTDHLRLLERAAETPGVDLILLTERTAIDRMRDLVLTGNTAQMADPAFMRELKSWIRFSPRQALETGDGLFAAASGAPVLPAWLGPALFDWSATAARENDKYARQMRASAGIAVFIGQGSDPEHWVQVGRACQRFALQATALGLRLAFVNQPVEVASLRPDLAALIGAPGRRPDLVMRFGHGPALPFSARRPATTA